MSGARQSSTNGEWNLLERRCAVKEVVVGSTLRRQERCFDDARLNPRDERRYGERRYGERRYGERCYGERRYGE